MTDSILGFLFSPWGWLSFAAIAAILEILIPGAYMIWLAVAALATALTVAAVPLTLDGQLAAFAVWIVVAVFASRGLRGRKLLAGGGTQGLNQPGIRLVGETATVTQAIEAGSGRVRMGDSEWLAQGPDAPVGARVHVTGMNGAILKVVPDA
jgi:inner membrane protein